MEFEFGKYHLPHFQLPQGWDNGEDYFRYLKNNIYFDSTHPMSWSKEELECAVQVCGADHILLGSSFPVFYEWMARSVGAINALDIDEEDRKLILGGNAARLFNL